ncbi:hypothetical protein Cyan10605_0329 [Cyanobacterium aponinum PCC 10605]|uniref:DUF3011 domain-containing protein n=2 Tax=Cyanobacterium TaxID=102234 RepID=K9YZU7_CYAAP|nr:hypothetical protein Cyan10605_0329 [Cyanobacterium aponinum PCC 10605]
MKPQKECLSVLVNKKEKLKMKHWYKLALISVISCGFFAQATPASAESRLTCESYKGRYKFCDADTRGGVKLIRQLSRTECRQGSTWGYDRNGIWVDRGCSAEFAVRGRGDNYNNNNNSSGDNTAAIIGGVLAVGAIAAAIASSSDNNNYDGGNTITCNSDRGNYTRCGADIRRGDRVVMRRQLSNSGCWEGSTWGYDRNGIWVDQGCRGVFEIRRR